jgi:hypothetical protein
MRGRLLSAIVAGALLATGCGDEDMIRFEDDGIAFTHPGDWQRLREVERYTKEDDGLVAAFEGDSGIEGATIRALAFNQEREPGTVGQYGKDAALTRPFQARGELVQEGEYEVRGAEGAWRVVVDYRMHPNDSEEIVPARIIDILPVNGDRQYRLTVSGPKQAVDSAQVDEIIESFEIVSD